MPWERILPPFYFILAKNRAANYTTEFCGRLLFWASSTEKINKDVKIFNWVLNNLTRSLELFH